MTSRTVEGACAFAWRSYLLSHSSVSEDDNRRSALHRYVTDLGDAGEDDFALLQIAAVAYLRNWTSCTTNELRELQQIKL
jgi:hypothetical protein